jgi:hypothetical protein
MDIILIVAGLLLWLVGGYFVAGIVLIVIGALLFVGPGWGPWGGYTSRGWYGRRHHP